MNKEEIEEIKRLLFQGRLTQYGKRKLVQYLEQKESILDKVTELANKIATENAEKYNSENQKEVDFSEWNIALEILNIIEGEKKNGK